MSQPSYEEAKHDVYEDVYELAKERCIEFFKREPTEEELEEEYQCLCEKYIY